MIVSETEVQTFQELVWQYYATAHRSMPWRNNTDPYYILVSELMLQQTQVDRVIPKFNAFVEAFPTTSDLAASSLASVLTLWSGLGYNRRAKFLHEAAKMIEHDFQGIIPHTKEELVQLPGIGPNTAGAILAYGFNQPVSFIETNIRTVYFHHFFNDQDTITDRELSEVVSETVDRESPRQWYWALMDYGTYLKKQGVGRNSRSAHYKKQPPLKGSVREIRGLILKALTTHSMTANELATNVIYDERFKTALDGLLKDGLISTRSGQFHLTK